MARYRFTIDVFLLFLCCSFCLADFFPDYDQDNPLPIEPHIRIRRHLKFISRKPGPDAEPETGIGFRGHLMNLLKGGTIGVEFHIPHVDRFGRKYPHWKDLFGDEGKKDPGATDEGNKDVLGVENREENEVDYTHINPRVKKDDIRGGEEP